MKITLAKYAGFCMGVRRALSLCLDVLYKKKGSFYTLGHIIHNNTVIEELELLGVKSTKDYNDLKKGDTVLIRSHGVTPQYRKQVDNAGLFICDATCPKVARVQGIINAHVKKGYFIIIIGDKGHAETQGLLGYAEQEGDGEVISFEEEAVSFISKMQTDLKVCIVAQTTQSIHLFDKLCFILNKHFVNLKIINTICDATQHRQEEISNHGKNFDRIIVAGARHSANTSRLFEIAQKSCKKVHHVERACELDVSNIGKKEKIFITAGASTPFWIIHEIIEKLNEKTLKGRLLSRMDSVFLFSFLTIFAILFSLYKKNYNLLIISFFCFLASKGIISYYLKRIDVLKIYYIFDKTFLVLGLVGLFIFSYWFVYSMLFVLYYLVLLYFINRQYPFSRKFVFFLSNFIFAIIIFLLV